MNVDEPSSPNASDEQPNSLPTVNQTPPIPPPPVYRPVTPKKKVRWWIPVTIGCGCLALLVVPTLIVLGIIGAVVGEEPIGGESIALIHVDGVITGGSEGGIFSDEAAGSERLVSLLEKARNDTDVRAVVLRINSPGGSAAGSEEIYNEILQVRKEKPVYASMGDVAASGGYYIASACNRIYANGATMTGSIGVIMEATDLSGLFKKIGMSPQVVKSGKYKDMGNPARPLTPDERSLLQGMINDTFDQFVTAVSNGRKMPKDKVKALATGRVFTGRQALQIKLVDKLGGLRETVLAAAKDVGLEGEPNVQRYDRRGGILGILDGGVSEDKYRTMQYDLLLDRLLKRFASQDNALESLR